MTKGVDIVVSSITLNNQAAVSGSYGNDSFASGIYQKIETYDNDFADVYQISPFQVGANKAAIIILHK